ncbi:MAG: hypothetical protein V1735_06335 [Nanoarchaeota archaeon]
MDESIQLGIEAPQHEAPPELPAFPDGPSGLKVWCRYCLCWHHHGLSFGNRCAHCRSWNTPYMRSGYNLRAPLPSERVEDFPPDGKKLTKRQLARLGVFSRGDED